MFIGMDLAASETKERVTRQLWIMDKTIFERDKPSDPVGGVLSKLIYYDSSNVKYFKNN